MPISKARIEEISAIIKFDKIHGYNNLIAPLKLEAAVFLINRDAGIPVEEAAEYVKAILTEAFNRAIGTLDMTNLVKETVEKFRSGELDYSVL